MRCSAQLSWRLPERLRRWRAWRRWRREVVRAGVHRELALAGEALGAGGLAESLARSRRRSRGARAAPRCARTSAAELALELCRAPGELAAAPRSSRQMRTCASARGGRGGERGVRARRGGRGSRRAARARARARAGASAGAAGCACARHEILAVVEEEPDLALGALETRLGSSRLAQRARRRERVDRVGLAARAIRGAPRPSAWAARARPLAASRAGSARARWRRAGSPRAPHRSSRARAPGQQLARARPGAPSPSLEGARPTPHRRRRRCGSACGVTRYDHSGPFPEVAMTAERQRTGLSGGVATLLSGHAGAPRTAAGDRSHAGQADRPTPSLRVSPPPTRA